MIRPDFGNIIYLRLRFGSPYHHDPFSFTLFFFLHLTPTSPTPCPHHCLINVQLSLSFSTALDNSYVLLPS